MNDYESIYTNHYEGGTYRFAVAYLIDGASMRTLDPDVRFPTLDEQRDAIAAHAKEHPSIVVAEFIERDGDEPLWDRRGFHALLEFTATNHPALVLTAGEEYLNLRAGERFHLIRALEGHGTRVISL